MRSTVKEILDEKGGTVWTMNSDESVYDALVKMSKKDIGALCVMENGKFAGIFTERDYARKVVLFGKSSKESTIGDLMTREVAVINQDTTIEECMTLMTKKRVRHLPVMEGDKFIGIISIGDVVNRIIKDQELTIKNLEDYIYGKPS
ncbi:MAG TPA: CBS domain-containing protein [Cyclobacteriaceae bacterium]|nr:CBS domain-containing protein [Cyclobacteriaceae bacterium]